jgi:hypothetical protein
MSVASHKIRPRAGPFLRLLDNLDDTPENELIEASS